MQNARQFMWMQGEFTGLAHPVWANPSGYFSPGAARNFVEFAVGRAENPRGRPTFEEQVADGMIIVRHAEDGASPSMRPSARRDAARHHGIWGNDGNVQPRGRARPASACSARR